MLIPELACMSVDWLLNAVFFPDLSCFGFHPPYSSVDKELWSLDISWQYWGSVGQQIHFLCFFWEPDLEVRAPVLAQTWDILLDQGEGSQTENIHLIRIFKLPLSLRFKLKNFFVPFQTDNEHITQFLFVAREALKHYFRWER